MTEYQKIIIKRQEFFLEKESQRYFAQKKRLDGWPRWKKWILGDVYIQLVADMEDLHRFNQNMVTNLAQQLMEHTFDTPIDDISYKLYY